MLIRVKTQTVGHDRPANPGGKPPEVDAIFRETLPKASASGDQPVEASANCGESLPEVGVACGESLLEVDVDCGGNLLEINASLGENLLEILRRAGVALRAPCGGRGFCGKCRVWVEGACLPPEARELAHLNGTAGTVRVPGTPQSRPDMPPQSVPEVRRLVPETLQSVQGAQPTSTAACWRLACVVMVQGDLTVTLPDSGEMSMAAWTMDDVMCYAPGTDTAPGAGANQGGKRADELSAEQANAPVNEAQDFPTNQPPNVGLAVDVGTTTVAAQLHDLRTGAALAQAAACNPQAAYGADVLSRLACANQDPKAATAMQQAICQCVAELAAQACASANAQRTEKFLSQKDTQIAAQSDGQTPTQTDEQAAVQSDGQTAVQAHLRVENITRVVAAGNTAMQHLLTGLPTEGLCHLPFEPYEKKTFEVSGASLGLPFDANVMVMPSLSGFVGGDALCAALACDLDEAGAPTLLLDLGTNGELLLADERGVMACSAAAGPAFEGGNIRCGMAAFAGAICGAAWRDGLCLTTVNHAPPVGLCGTGLVSVMAVLLGRGFLHASGRLQNLPPELACSVDDQPAVLLAQGPTGPVVLTAADIRAFQLAKAAVAAGVKILLQKKGLAPEKLSRVYLAGGFGAMVDPAAVCAVGILDAGLQGKITAVGNAAAQGAARVLLDARQQARVARMREEFVSLNLSAHPDFQDTFVDCMMF